MKKLSKYSLMSIAALGGVNANADIIYTDVDPDETYTDSGDEYELDLNNDGKVDYTISNYSFSFTYYFGFIQVNGNVVNMTPESGNSMLALQSTYSTTGGGTGTNTQFSPIRANEAISSGQEFISNTSALLGFNEGNIFGYSFEYQNGNFKDTIYDQFIGLKFEDGGSTYYGWARVSVQAEAGSQSFTVFDYAYEDSGDPILAGHGIISPGSLSLNDELALEELNISKVGNQLHITSAYNIKGVISLVDISGKVIASEAVNGKTLEMNISNVSQGIYIVNITTQRMNGSRKITI